MHSSDDAATAAILASFEIEADVQNLRNAVRSRNEQVAREMHVQLTAKIQKAGAFLDAAFQQRG